jgi:hypothetical protein
MLRIFKRTQTTPQEIADQAQRTLSGECRKWDVDSYENRSLKDPTLNDLHSRTLSFGLPETWVKLDDVEKKKLRGIIEEMRQLRSDRPSSPFTHGARPGRPGSHNFSEPSCLHIVNKPTHRNLPRDPRVRLHPPHLQAHVFFQVVEGVEMGRLG